MHILTMIIRFALAHKFHRGTTPRGMGDWAIVRSIVENAACSGLCTLSLPGENLVVLELRIVGTARVLISLILACSAVVLFGSCCRRGGRQAARALALRLLLATSVEPVRLGTRKVPRPASLEKEA